MLEAALEAALAGQYAAVPPPHSGRGPYRGYRGQASWVYETVGEQGSGAVAQHHMGEAVK